MLIKKSADLKYSDVTPKNVYTTRREFLATLGISAGLGGALLTPRNALAGGTKLPIASKSQFSTTEKINSLEDVTHYNNFYEFGTDKREPAEYAKNYRTSPWTVSVEGQVEKPQKFDLASLMKLAPLEERIYRHRCVEAWSIVVPWAGYSLSALLKAVGPTSKAKYVAFQSDYDPKQMPHAYGIQFPYIEGLRLDEAMHPLALLTFGMYGETLAPQDGAPVRLVVPWKYGFKSIKSIVKIKLVEKQPPCTWNLMAPNEYGFYSNVNPHVDHPRWSQATERRLGELFKRQTLMFNGYDKEVADLYTGLDLKKNF
jgi:methionine sulfoxide reductase catalytic subunit